MYWTFDTAGMDFDSFQDSRLKGMILKSEGVTNFLYLHKIPYLNKQRSILWAFYTLITQEAALRGSVEFGLPALHPWVRKFVFQIIRFYQNHFYSI